MEIGIVACSNSQGESMVQEQTKFLPCKSIKVKIVYTPEQFAKIEQGHKASEMEDHWDIRYEDGWLHIARSWTGVEIYKAPISKRGGNYEISELFVVIGADWGYEDDNDEADAFELIIASRFLDKQISERFFKRQEQRMLDKYRKCQ